MIKSLAAMVTGSVDLLEAEGRLARLHLVRVGALMAVLLACAVMTAAALVAVGAGTVVVLAERIGLGAALLWVGAVGALLGVGAAASAWSTFRSGGGE